jgi:hypothetical protein
MGGGFYAPAIFDYLENQNVERQGVTGGMEIASSVAMGRLEACGAQSIFSKAGENS